MFRNGVKLGILCLRYGGLIGPFAMLSRKPRQARKGAAVAVDVGAGVRLIGLPPL